jgi:hypothetical protein
MSEGGSMPGVAYLAVPGHVSMNCSISCSIFLYISIAILAMVLDVNQHLAAGDSTSQQIHLYLLLFD